MYMCKINLRAAIDQLFRLILLITLTLKVLLHTADCDEANFVKDPPVVQRSQQNFFANT
jgi:hypothetical protein